MSLNLIVQLLWALTGGLSLGAALLNIMSSVNISFLFFSIGMVAIAISFFLTEKQK